MKFTVPRCTDSHVHWQATGEIGATLNLSHLRSADEVQDLRIEPQHFRGDWLVGFGWDQNLWDKKQFPDKNILDRLFAETPVSFTRTDGHAAWVNSEALRRAGLLQGRRLSETGGQCRLDPSGEPTGILLDLAKTFVDELIPAPAPAQIRHFLKAASDIFNRAGFTHIRDVGGSIECWTEARKMDENHELTLAVEMFFGCEKPEIFPQILKLAVEAQHTGTQHLRCPGVKLYYDGALGSEGALLSQPYASGSGQGLRLLTPEFVRDCALRCSDHGLDLAIHTLGDQAAHEVITAIGPLWEEKLFRTTLHLEHVEVLRPETIELMRGKKVRCHLQPCHWLSDRRWLKEKLGSLARQAFPWGALAEAQVPFDFGSDSPIEPPSFWRNFEALEQSAQAGIPALPDSIVSRHSHPDKGWGSESYSEFTDGDVSRVVFEGTELRNY